MSLTRRNLFRAAAVLGAGAFEIGNIPPADAAGGGRLR